MHRISKLGMRIRQTVARAALRLHGRLLEGTTEPSGLPQIVEVSGGEGSARDYRLRRDACDRVTADLQAFAESASDEEVARLSATCTALLEWMRLQTSAEFWRESERWRIREFVIAAKASENDDGMPRANPVTRPETPETPAPPSASESRPTESTLLDAPPAVEAAPQAAQEAVATAPRPTDGPSSRRVDSPAPAAPAGVPFLAQLADLAGKNATSLVDGALERTRAVTVPAPSEAIVSTTSNETPGRKHLNAPTEAAGRLVYLPGDRPHERPVFDLAKALRDLPAHVPPSSVGAPSGAKLSVGIVPAPCRSTGIDRLLAPEVRLQVAKSIATASGWVCTGCGAKLDLASDCREVFHYDDAVHIQTLIDVVAVCPKCFRLPECLAGPPSDSRYLEAIEHLMEVNDWEQLTAESYANAINALAEWRSRAEWVSDLTWLEKLCVKVTREDLERAVASPATSGAVAG